MGPKAYEQCAGFLRIEEAANPLDNSSVHPESYAVVEKMAGDLGVSVKELIGNIPLCEKINPARYVTADIGLPTLGDIIGELKKTGRDPRSVAEVFSFAEGIKDVDDLHEGMILPGIVTNITDFGAFVDIGIKQDGLVHVSEMADRYVSNPAEVLSLHQHIRVRVIQVDRERKRIALSLKQTGEEEKKNRS